MAEGTETEGRDGNDAQDKLIEAVPDLNVDLVEAELPGEEWIKEHIVYSA